VRSCLMYGRLTSSVFSSSTTLRMWIDLKRERCLAAMSWYRASTASVLDISRYSLYMLWVPDRESYRIQMPKFLTLRGRFSWITLRLTISPLAFLTFLSFIKKYQKRDFATTVLTAKIRIRYSLGEGFASVGRWRPMTWYSVRRPNSKDVSSSVHYVYRTSPIIACCDIRF